MNSVNRLKTLATIGMAGASWYDDARDYIWSETERNGWDMSRFIDVFAILSPRVSVVRNWEGTVEYFRSGKLPYGFIKSTRAALAHYESTGEIRGRKTSAFALALHGDTTALVLDVWMARAPGVGERVVTRLDNIRAAHRRIAAVGRALGLSVRDTQAAVWWGVCLTNGVRPGNLQTAAQATSQVSFDF